MEKAFIEKSCKAVEYKVNKVDNNWVNYAIRAMAAGMFLTLVYTFCTQILSDFDAAGGGLGAPVAKVLMAYFFGIALIFIIYFGAELFTSNTMYMTIGVAKKKTTVAKWFKVLIFCWVFNFIGAAFCSFLLVQTGLFNAAADGTFPNEALYNLAAKKATAPSMQILFRGILANWVVCVVVYIAGIVKEDTAKLLIVPLGLVPFVYLGFEHSIANFGVFFMTWFTPGAAAFGTYHDMAFTTMGAFRNLLFATGGNIIGGALLVGGYFAFLHRDKKEN